MKSTTSRSTQSITRPLKQSSFQIATPGLAVPQRVKAESRLLRLHRLIEVFDEWPQGVLKKPENEHLEDEQGRGLGRFVHVEAG